MDFTEEKFNTLARTVADGIVIIDLKGTVVYCNDGFLTLTGFSENEIVGRHFTRIPTLSNIKDMPKYVRLFPEIVKGRKIKGFEFIWHNKAGESRYGLGSLSKIRITDKEYGFIGVVSDITEDKELKNSMKQERDQLLLLLEGIDESIVVTDPETYKILFQNKANRKINGNIAGKYCYKEFYNLDFPCSFCNIKTLFAGNSKTIIVNEKYNAYLKKWFINYSKLILWLGGKKVRLSLAKDITQRKTAELALAKSEEKYRELVENLPEAFAEMDLKGRVIYCNKAAVKMTGYSKKELKNGFHITDFIIKSDHKRLNENFQKTLKGFIVGSQEYRALRKDKNMIVVAVHPNLVRDNNSDEITGTRSILIDITDKKAADEKLKYLSFHDSLTGLYNRAYFDEELNRIDTERSLPISIIVGDLNNLKLINDAFGHESGDNVLVKTAKIISGCLRSGDIIARWGGDEFSIILPNTPLKTAQILIDRTYTECEKQHDKKLPLSISLGAAEKTHKGQDIMKVLQDAENIMYRRKLNDKNSLRSSIISTLEKTLKLKSFETEEHSERLKETGLKLGRKLELSDSDLDKLLLLSKLHDIGKIIVPEIVLKKKSGLTVKEFEVIKKHPEAGYNICSGSTTLAYIAEDILCHHEWYNGKGYPRGLKGQTIPVTSRILSIIDAYDVMIYGRPYKKKMTKEQAIDELNKFSGIQFDPEFVSLFIDILNE
jgi:diguanylate cyclase (GGDEF)-like protein/PAS domain S-box-containing protein